MRRLAKLLAALGPPVVGGALIGCSLPPVGSWPLGLVGFALVVTSLRGQRARRRFAIGLLAGIGQFSVGVAWALQFTAVGYVALVIVESLLLAVAMLLVRSDGLGRLPAAAGAFALAEWTRDSWPFGGVPLGSAALGQIGGPLQFAARLGGPLLLVFMAALIGGCLGELAVLSARAARERRRAREPAGVSTRRADGVGARPRVVVALGGIVVAGALAGAGVALAPAVPTPGAGKRLSVAIVQGGGRRGLTALQVPTSRVLAAAFRETARATGHPRLILWPEDVVSMGATKFRGSSAEHKLAALARSRRATLLVGVVQDVGTTRFLNEVVAFSPAGRIVASYEKVHRVPFGEYVPYRSFFSHFANLSAVPRDAIAGSGSGLVAARGARFAVMISYEDFFADRGRSGVRAGGELMLVPTNTSSYSNSQAPAQEIAASRLQAIEEGRYLLQAAPTGYSAVISPSGVVLRRSALSVPAVIETSVPLLTGHTPYEEGGDLPVVVASAVLVAAGAVLGVTSRRSRRRRRRRRPRSWRERGDGREGGHDGDRRPEPQGASASC